MLTTLTNYQLSKSIVNMRLKQCYLRMYIIPYHSINFHIICTAPVQKCIK